MVSMSKKLSMTFQGVMQWLKFEIHVMKSFKLIDFFSERNDRKARAEFFKRDDATPTVTKENRISG